MKLKHEKKYILILVLLCCLFTFSNRLQAQATGFISYGVEQGLPQSQVQAIIQDNDGNLWVGTLAGLTKYNGKSFTSYTKKDGLAEDWVTSSYKDKSGNLWFGHWAGSVSRYNYKLKEFENLHLEAYTRFKKITSITEDNTSRLWIATEGAGIFIYDPVRNMMLSLSTKDGLSSNNTYSIKQDEQGNIWIATDNGICIYNPKSTSQKFNIINTEKGLKSNRITALAQVNNNEMWVGTADAGVLILKTGENFSIQSPEKILPEAKSIDINNGLSSNFIETIYEDNLHHIWIGTTGGGITQCIPFNSQNREESISKAIFNTYSTKQGLNYFNANVVFEDREGNIWIGTDVGLNQYRGEIFQVYDESDSLINNLIWSVLCDHEGNIWLGTNEGLSKISFKQAPLNNKQVHSIKNYNEKDGLSGNVVLSMFEDKDNNLWFGTATGGVCRLGQGGNKFETFSKKDGLAGDMVFTICSDNQNNIWFGTKEGASKFDTKTSSFTNYTIANGLGGNNIYRIFKDSKGNLWFGALGGMLSVFDGTVFKTFNDTSGISNRFILCINEDKEKNLWFGSYGNGLYKYDGRGFRNYTTKDGMYSNSPYSIIADEENNIWIGSRKGIDKLNLQTNTFSHYGRQEGFSGVEINPNAVCRDNNGNIWFGTIMGAIKYNPKEDKLNKVAPQTFITGLKVFMEDRNFPEDAKFSYNENHLTFTFLGISLINPQKVLYQYKLEGFDKDWLPGYTALNEAVYSNLPPGNYTFMVKACNSDGIWNREPVKYKFFVAPPFWQTTLFYIAMAIVVFFLLYGASMIRNRNLLSEKKKLEEKVKELSQKERKRNVLKRETEE